MPNTEGKCCICGRIGPLSREHVPPRRAFNEDTVLLQALELHSGELTWQGKQRQGGSAERVSCRKCNNDTGSWYARPYIEFIKQLVDLAHEGNAQKDLPITVRDVFPLRIIKQVLAMFCCTCGTDFSDKQQILRELILNREKTGSIDPLHIYLYLKCQRSGRYTTGITSPINFKTSYSQIVAEVSWWPVGWILLFDDQSVDAFNVTHWLHEYDYDKSDSIPLTLPCHYSQNFSPLDFRSPEETK